MDLQSILAAILNPNGTQQAQPMPQMSAAAQVGDHNNPAWMQAAQARLGQAPQAAPPPQMPPQATQNVAQQQNAPQQAPQPQQAAPSGGLGGLGGILQSIIAPQSAQKTKTVAWLTSQGYDPGAATVLAADKTALRQLILTRGQGTKPTEAIQNYLFAKQDGYSGTFADFNGKKADQREIKNDANGTPRFVDTGEPVYPGDQNTGKEMFTGKSIEAQGLNYLIAHGMPKDQAAQVAAGKTVTGPNGEVIFMTPQGIFQQPAGGGAPQSVGDGSSGNIPITGPKYSEDMRKSLGFANRAAASDTIIADPNISAAGTSLGQNFKADIPLVGNAMVTPEFQKFDQAQRDFINAVLRRESGAAISPAEFDNARKQYLPQYGDGPDVLKQKADNRRLTIQGLHQSADPVPSLTGSAPMTQAAPSAAPAGGDTPPASYTGKNWKYMSPEARKLWQ